MYNSLGIFYVHDTYVALYVYKQVLYILTPNDYKAQIQTVEFPLLCSTTYVQVGTYMRILKVCL